jgi:hypothetical protein
MKPKPLVELNHFTVPVVIDNPPFWQDLSLTDRMFGEFRTISKGGDYQSRAKARK